MATITYKCPNCDGGLIFDPATQEYRCEFCQSHFTQQQLEHMMPEKAADQASQAVLYTCPSCGAEIVTDATTAATFCYYCHNPVVLAGKLEGGYRPSYVIPFQIDKEKAQEIFTQWVARKKFVPREFYSPKQIETMTGVYFPYWLFSCKVRGAVNGEGTRLRMWNTGNLRYTETKIYDVKREGSVLVDHVARNALKKANRCLVDGVQPFEMTAAEPFSMGYLSGFMAENRDMEQNVFEPDVQQEVKDFALDILRGQASDYSSVRVSSQQADIVDGRWEYALLPVWTLTYSDRARGKIYYFALNGQTGKVCGELPVDKKKLMILFLSIFLPMFMILLTVGYLI